MHCLLNITGNRTIAVRALLDTGAGGEFVSKRFAELRRIPLKPLSSPVTVYNVDHTPNKEGKITHYTDLTVTIGGTPVKTRFLATNLGGEAMIIGVTPSVKHLDQQI